MSAPVFSQYKWYNPNVSYSWMLDGCWNGMGDQSQLFAIYDAAYSRDVWQNEFRRALQCFQNHCGLVFNEVPEQVDPSTGMGWSAGVQGKAQGDPRFGDIRFGTSARIANGHATSPTIDPWTSGGTTLVNGIFDIASGQLFALVIHELGGSMGMMEGQPEPSILNGTAWPDPPGGGLWTDLTTFDQMAMQMLYGPPGGTPVPPQPQPVPATLGRVASEICHSPEAIDHQVKLTYQSGLGRTPSSAEISGPVNQIASGHMTLQDEWSVVYGSPECWGHMGSDKSAWVVGIYQGVLGRTPSQDEINMWVSQL